MTALSLAVPTIQEFSKSPRVRLSMIVLDEGHRQDLRLLLSLSWINSVSPGLSRDFTSGYGAKS